MPVCHKVEANQNICNHGKILLNAHVHDGGRSLDFRKLNLDVLCINEHWVHALRHHMHGKILKYFDYLQIRDREDYGSCRGQGGVAIFWRKALKCVTPY